MCEVITTQINRYIMFPWGAIIGLAGQAVSGALSITNNRRMQQEADAEAARRKAFYDAKANENPLSRSEVQHVLGQYDRSAQQQIENARGVAAIKGSTPEFAAAVQKGVAEGRANLMGQVAAGASQRADYYNMLGEQAQHQKAREDMQRRMQRNSTYAALAGNAASAVGAIMDGYSAKMPKAEAPTLNNDPSAPETKAAEQSGYSDQQKVKLKAGQPPTFEYALNEYNSGKLTNQEFQRMINNMDLSEQSKWHNYRRQHNYFAAKGFV